MTGLGTRTAMAASAALSARATCANARVQPSGAEVGAAFRMDEAAAAAGNP